MSCRQIGFTARDFAELSLPELYLRLCLACAKEK